MRFKKSMPALLIVITSSIISCTVQQQCAGQKASYVTQRQYALFQGYDLALIKAELQKVIPAIAHEIPDERIARTYFSFTKNIFELTKFPGIIFKAETWNARMTQEDHEAKQQELARLRSIIEKNNLNLLSLPRKTYLWIADHQQNNWRVRIEEKGELAAPTNKGQQELFESYTLKAHDNKSIAQFLASLFKQLTTFVCLSGITDITHLNFPLLKNGRIMIVDTDLPKEKNVSEGLANLLYYANPNYFEIILNQAALTLNQTVETIMHHISVYLGKQLNESVSKHERMRQFKEFIAHAKQIRELKFIGMGILENIHSWFFENQNQQPLWT